MHWFPLATAIAWALIVVAAGLARGRFFAIFAGVFLGVQGLCAVGLFRLFEPLWPLYAYLQLCVMLHFLTLTRPRMRPLPWRLLVSLPGLYFGGATLIGLPWAVVAALGFDPWVPWLPFVVAGWGLVQSLWARREQVDLVLGGEPAGDEPRRHARGACDDGAPVLRIVQITDPHLGPFMSVKRLRGFCERAVQEDPDLVLLTGDFLTMESQRDPALLEDSLRPLEALEGRVFACFGNHDYEAPDLVKRALAAVGAQLLIDEEAVVQTPIGAVQIVGADFRFRDRAAHLTKLAEDVPRRDEHLRVMLLHDPDAFRHVPEGDADLVLSGHTHGGQLGLLSLGLSWTFVSGFTSIPDHGFWGRGRDRLYVHRGTGVYGFPLRIGVPGEDSVLRVQTRA